MCMRRFGRFPGIPRGRGLAKESDPIKPVEVENVEATLPHMPTPVAAMVQLQLLTGMRPGEVMVMRAIDLNMNGSAWTYTPHKHKNKHRGMERTVYLGPAKEIVRPFLLTNLEAYLFSPKAYVEAMRVRRAEQRKTKRTPSELNRKRKAKPKRTPESGTTDGATTTRFAARAWPRTFRNGHRCNCGIRRRRQSGRSTVSKRRRSSWDMRASRRRRFMLRGT